MQTRTLTLSAERNDAAGRLQEAMLAAVGASEDGMLPLDVLDTVIWQADVLGWGEEASRALTGLPYRRENVQRARGGEKARSDLVEAKRAEVVVMRDPMGCSYKCLRGIEKPRGKLLDESEIERIGLLVISHVEASKQQTQRRVRPTGWLIARIGEQIPYNAVYLSDEEITNRDIERTRELMLRRHERAAGDARAQR